MRTDIFPKGIMSFFPVAESVFTPSEWRPNLPGSVENVYTKDRVTFTKGDLQPARPDSLRCSISSLGPVIPS